ncbi:choice-of-anchor L domain-containing protein [Psychroflexus planctonicus]|nr:choice-of-anchor L domain-containing protein [Psychroflexus planctonicus]
MKSSIASISNQKQNQPFFLCFCFFLFAIQIISSQVQYSENPTNEELVQSFQGENITISNANLISGDRMTQIALFENGINGANLEIDQGIYFSTGDLNEELSNINSDDNSSVSNNFTYEDEDLLLIEEGAIFDVVLFEFDISLSSQSNNLLFTYQFASEEYPDYVGSVFNDVFAIFIEGPGFNGTENIAKIPSSGKPTAVNFVNGGVLGSSSSEEVEVDLTQTDFYINNGHLNTGESNPENQPGPFLVHVEFNGITTAITSEVQDLEAGETYHIKIALADTADPIFDSGVFFTAIGSNEIQPELKFNKDAVYLGDSERALPGDEVLYFFDIINEGEIEVSNITFEDDFFEDAEIEGLSDLTLAPGESYSFELNYFINQQEINEGVLYNLANITYEAEEEFSKSSTDPTPLPEDHPFFNADCQNCTAIVLPQQPGISLTKTVEVVEDSPNILVGDQISYRFNMKNTGNVDLFDVQLFDDMPGLELNGNPLDLLVNEEIQDHFSGVYFVTVSDFAQRKIENQAVIRGYTFLNEEVSDMSDFELFTEDRPTVLEIPPCEVKIYNTITPNGDNVNDVFFIEGIECFPDNEVQIFNRWGVEVYSEKEYNNADVSFTGISNARASFNKEEGLPSGVYYYIVQFVNADEEREVRKGTLYIKQEK